LRGGAEVVVRLVAVEAAEVGGDEAGADATVEPFLPVMGGDRIRVLKEGLRATGWAMRIHWFLQKSSVERNESSRWRKKLSKKGCQT
jgi:hypothetical protein